MFGVTGSLFSEWNGIYFVTGTEVEKLPAVTFVRLYVQELEKLRSLFPRLICLVDSEYKEAMKLLELVGFKKMKEVLFKDKMSYLYELT